MSTWGAKLLDFLRRMTAAAATMTGASTGESGDTNMITVH